MTHDELALSPFTRSIAGPCGTVLLRRNEEHAHRCRLAIQRRNPPRWSRQDPTYTVTDRGGFRPEKRP